MCSTQRFFGRLHPFLGTDEYPEDEQRTQFLTHLTNHPYNEREVPNA